MAAEIDISELAAKLEALKAQVQRLEDEREISDLISRYGYLVDLPMEEEWLGLFTEDCVMDASFGHGVYEHESRWEGIDAFREFINDTGGRCRPEAYLRTMHLTNLNMIIHIDGDEATADAYSTVILRPEDGPLRLTTAGVSQWKCRRVNGVWKLVQRTRREIADPEGTAKLIARSLAG